MITITIAIILFTYNAWDEYKEQYKISIRTVEIECVERLRKCRKPMNGYKTYECPNCKKRKYVAFTCKCRLCTSCGTKMVNEWANKIHQMLIDVTHRHIVLTIPRQLSQLLGGKWDLYKVLIEAAQVTLMDMYRYSNKMKRKLRIGLILVLQTYGGDLRYNIHLHGIVTEGGFDRKKNWVSVSYITYHSWRKKWQYEVLTRLRKRLPKGRDYDTYIDALFKQYPNGFVLNGERRVKKDNAWPLIRYLGRYVRHPPIANSRLIRNTKHHVKFSYKDAKTGRNVEVTLEKVEFIKRLLSHIPDKNFKVARRFGIYSRRKQKWIQSILNIENDNDEVIIKMSWQESITKTFGEDPLICDKCGVEMALIDICYCGTDSYPSETDRPPPNENRSMGVDDLSQSEKVKIILSTIRSINTPDYGAYVGMVIEIASDKGIDRAETETIIKHLREGGQIYEPVYGRIRCVN